MPCLPSCCSYRKVLCCCWGVGTRCFILLSLCLIWFTAHLLCALWFRFCQKQTGCIFITECRASSQTYFERCRSSSGHVAHRVGCSQTWWKPQVTIRSFLYSQWTAVCITMAAAVCLRLSAGWQWIQKCIDFHSTTSYLQAGRTKTLIYFAVSSDLIWSDPKLHQNLNASSFARIPTF